MTDPADRRFRDLLHELAQPLNIIRMAAEGAQLMIERGKATPDWQARQFDLVAAQSHVAAEILDRIRRHRRPGPPPSALVLVVEEITADIEPLGLLLRELECRVGFTATGRQAWAAFQAEAADVVVFGPTVPEEDAKTLLNHLRDFDPLLPVIAIVNGPEDVTARRGAGFDDDRCAVLPVPVTVDTLRPVIRAFLEPPSE